MPGFLRAALGLWLLAVGAATAAEPERVAGKGWSLLLPAGWEHKPGLMGAELVARPPRSDTAGWASDQLILSRETYDARRTCLDGFVLRKLRDMGHLAEDFKVIEEQPLELGSAVGSRLELSYREGPRQLRSYLTVMATAKEMIVLTLGSDPARFEFRRAEFRRVSDSLRPAEAGPTGAHAKTDS